MNQKEEIEASVEVFEFVKSKHEADLVYLGEGSEKDSEGTEKGGEGSEGGGNA